MLEAFLFQKLVATRETATSPPPQGLDLQKLLVQLLPCTLNCTVKSKSPACHINIPNRTLCLSRSSIKPPSPKAKTSSQNKSKFNCSKAKDLARIHFASALCQPGPDNPPLGKVHGLLIDNPCWNGLGECS